MKESTSLFSQLSLDEVTSPTPITTSRRKFVAQLGTVFFSSSMLAALLLPTVVGQSSRANAAEDDGSALSSSNVVEFNADGSLKDPTVIQTEAKERVVSLTFDDENKPEDLQLNIDGESTSGSSSSGGNIKVSYKLPEKWKRKGSEGVYVDTSGEGANRSACSKITVYKAAGLVPDDRLTKATRLGVGKSLGLPNDLEALKKADVIGGRKLDKDFSYEEHEYYEFDMALAPKTCGDGGGANDNLEIGGIICPYETIYLVSSTIWQNNLYVMVLESTQDEWKQANAELKRVRSSFVVRGSSSSSSSSSA